VFLYDREREGRRGEGVRETSEQVREVNGAYEKKTIHERKFLMKVVVI
jgi:hypothetical protein